MMRHRTLFNLALAAGVLLGLAGCDLTAQRALQVAQAGPQAWIDKPLNGANLPEGQPAEVLAHASDSVGVQQFEFSVNGALQGSSAPSGQIGMLFNASFPWTPPGPGNYTLSVRALNAAGVWGPSAQVVVTVGGGALPTPTTPPPDEAPEANPEATPTPTAAAAPVLPTDTPVPPPCAPAAPVLTQPGNGAGVSVQPTLQWGYRGTCQPTGYSLQIATGPDFGALVVDQGVGAATSFTVPFALAQCTPYYWHVATFNGATFGAYSEVWTFTTECPPPPDTAAPTVSVIVEPSTPAETVPVKGTANASDNVGVTRIEIYVARPNARSITPVMVCENTTVCVFEQIMASGDWNASASAWDAAGNRGNSSVASFYVQVVPR